MNRIIFVYEDHSWRCQLAPILTKLDYTLLHWQRQFAIVVTMVNLAIDW